MRKSTLFFSLGIIILSAAGIFFMSGSNGPDVNYRLAVVERGTIKKSVSASGELNAVVTVEVGSEISGQISQLSVDYNSAVTAGQVIARIDPEGFIARVRQAEAELAVAKASVATKKAGISQSIANLGNARSVMAAVSYTHLTLPTNREV